MDDAVGTGEDGEVEGGEEDEGVEEKKGEFFLREEALGEEGNEEEPERVGEVEGEAVVGLFVGGAQAEGVGGEGTGGAEVLDVVAEVDHVGEDFKDCFGSSPVGGAGFGEEGVGVFPVAFEVFGVASDNDAGVHVVGGTLGGVGGFEAGLGEDEAEVFMLFSEVTEAGGAFFRGS